MKIKISASLGFANRNEECIEVDDDLTDDEIGEEVYEHIGFASKVHSATKV